MAKKDGQDVERVVKASQPKFIFSEHQNIALKKFWSGINGLDRLADTFILELRHYMEYYSTEIIANSNKQIETAESEKYLNIAKLCGELGRLFKDIPELDRYNLLSVREERKEKNIPICDPLEYVVYIKEQAEDHSYKLKKYAKHEQQLIGFNVFIERFSPCRKLTRAQFVDFFCIVHEDENDTEKRLQGRILERIKIMGGYKKLTEGVNVTPK
mgnify:CR=1 FL=1